MYYGKQKKFFRLFIAVHFGVNGDYESFIFTRKCSWAVPGKEIHKDPNIPFMALDWCYVKFNVRKIQIRLTPNQTMYAYLSALSQMSNLYLRKITLIY